MGTIASTPRQDAQPKEHADYLLGVLVGENNFDLQSSLWQRLLGLPLTLYWPDNVIEEACESLARNNTFTSHFAKLLIHLAWSLQEAASVKPTVHGIFAKGINAVRFSCVFLKYFIDHLKSDQMERLLSICLNEKDAEATGLSTGKKSVAVLVVPALMDFIVNSDINPSTYLLHLEVVNLLLVMMATQLHSEASLETKDCHIFLDTAMAQERTLVSLFIRKLLLSYITTLPVPADAAYYMSISKRNYLGLIHRVGSAAGGSFALTFTFKSNAHIAMYKYQGRNSCKLQQCSWVSLRILPSVCKSNRRKNYNLHKLVGISTWLEEKWRP